MGQQKVNEESFGVIPYREDGGKRLYLLIQHNGGHWAFPKGHKEENETDLETAKRELHEETGITEVTLDETKRLEEYYSYIWNNEPRHKRVTYFIGKTETTNIDVLQKELQDAAWFRYEEATQKITHDEAKRLLKETEEYLKK